MIDESISNTDDILSSSRLEAEPFPSPRLEKHTNTDDLLSSSQLEDEPSPSKRLEQQTPKKQENILRPEAPSFHVEDPKLVNSGQKVVGPDPSWIAAENKVNTSDGIPLHVAPVPPPIWSGTRETAFHAPSSWQLLLLLPASWNNQNLRCQ